MQNFIRYKQTKRPKWLMPLLIFVVLGYFFLFRPILKIKAKANTLMASARELKNVFAQNDITLLKTKLGDFSKEYQDFGKTARSLYWSSFIPYVGDFRALLEAAYY